ncbi:MAG: C-terminal target protein [Bacteroidetes bacterium]|nr:C-terminal target protein [Bacteroidota bacterium]
MKKIIFVLLALFTCFGIKAQVLQEVYHNDKMVIKDFNKTYQYNSVSFIDNQDNEDALIYVRDSISSIKIINNNLDVSDICNFPDGTTTFLKLNNKFYGYNYFWDSTTNVNNLNLIRMDSTGTMLSSHVIRNSNEDSLYWMLQKVILLNNKEILFSFIASPTYPSIFEFTYTKLIKVDTMGNVLRTKNFNDSISGIDIGYFDDQVLYSFMHNSFIQERNKIYFLNRETLEIEDSIVGYSATNMKEINDSTLTFLGENGKEIHYMPYLILCPTFDYYIYNKNTKFTHPISRIYNYLYDNVFLFWNYFDGFGGTEKNKIDFINQDSIYSVFNLRELTLSSDRYIGFGLINYKQSGDTNFVYKIIYNDSTINFIALDEIKATRDGGAILLIGYNLKNCIVKFMPNGLTSILDIETKEKETIKVYPNPAKDYIYVDIEANNFKKGEIELFDIQGKLVKKTKLESKQGNRINVSSFKAGAYTYNVNINGKTISGKLIIGK